MQRDPRGDAKKIKAEGGLLCAGTVRSMPNACRGQDGLYGGALRKTRDKASDSVYMLISDASSVFCCCMKNVVHNIGFTLYLRCVVESRRSSVFNALEWRNGDVSLRSWPTSTAETTARSGRALRSNERLMGGLVATLSAICGRVRYEIPASTRFMRSARLWECRWMSGSRRKTEVEESDLKIHYRARRSVSSGKTFDRTAPPAATTKGKVLPFAVPQ